jgi:hypothetical protein
LEIDAQELVVPYENKANHNRQRRGKGEKERSASFSGVIRSGFVPSS